MPITKSFLHQLGDWCRSSIELTDERIEARRQFFSEDDPEPVSYEPGSGDAQSTERRFIGYFLFDHQLPSGETPALLAARRLCTERELTEVLPSLSRASYVMGAVRLIVRRSVYLTVDGREVEVRDAEWAGRFKIPGTVYAHLVPTRHGYSVPGPGWLSLPIQLGPNILAGTSSVVPDPVMLERYLQGRRLGERGKRDEGDASEVEALPRDDSLDAAVARMSAWAEAYGEISLVRTAATWTEFILPYMRAGDSLACFEATRADVESVLSLEEARELMRLWSNVWNNTPRPDRGGRSPNQLADEARDRGEPVISSLTYDSKDI